MDRQKLRIRVIVPACVAVLLLVVWASMRPAPATSQASRLANQDEIDALALSLPGPGDPRPRAVVEEPEHNFGVMDLGQIGEHTFLIRNEGDAPLELRQGPTTCRCTLSNLTDDSVLPQGVGEVTLTWEPRVGGVQIRQSATIFTNAPDNREIKLVVVGKVLAFASVTPLTLLFPDVQADQPATRRALVFSQAWDHFEIAGINPTGPRMTWTVKPAPADILERISAKAGYLIDVTVEPGLPAGEFGGQLLVKVAFPRHPNAGEVPPVLLDIAGKVQSSVAIYHPRIRGGRFDLGQWSTGQVFKETFPVYFRGEHARAEIIELTAEPDFVAIQQVKRERISDQLSVHTIELEIPNGVRPSQYNGEIFVVSDHPSNPEVRIPLRFVISAN